MFSSLPFRLWLTYLLVVGVVILIIGGALLGYLVRNPAEERQELQRLRLIASLVYFRSDIFNDSQGTVPPLRLQNVAEKMDKALRARVVLYDEDGNLQADSRRGLVSVLPDWSFFAAQKEDQASDYRDEKGMRWLFFIKKLDNGKTLVISAPRQRVPVWNILRQEFVGPFIRAGALALFLALLLAVGIARWVAGPLQQIAEAARTISLDGDATSYQPVTPKGPGEVQLLTKAFNEMADRVKKSQVSQRDFVANVSHELKTPLTSIQGFAQAILDGTASTPQALEQAAGVIFAEAGRMHRLVLDLLDLTRMDTGLVNFDFQPLGMQALLELLVSKFSPQAKAVEVDLQQDLPALPVVSGDADRLTQVFTNLVDNALKFTPPGGKILVEARSIGEWVIVSVADTGPGIPDEEMSRIFERFYQTDKSRRGGSRRGVGLGLAIAREIVQAHDGVISFQNDPVQGAVFVVKMPVARHSGPASLRRRDNRGNSSSD